MKRLPLAILLMSLLLLGSGCFGSNVQIRPITLEYWRMDDSPDALEPVIEAYRKMHPNVTIKVRSFRTEEYKQSLLEALAEDRGPDIFNIPNVWLPAWKGKLLPAPETLVIPTEVVDPNKQEIVAVNQEVESITKLEVMNRYVEAVEKDVIMLTEPEEDTEERPRDAIWGLPYSCDTLAMFYNEALLRSANIEEPPNTWKGLQDHVKMLTSVNEEDRIEQSGAAIGAAKNVRHHTDILSAIMMQNGAQMIDEDGYAIFDKRTPRTRDGQYPPGVEALVFYQSFGIPGRSTYTWDDYLPDSMDAFIAGKTAYYFGFPYDRITIGENAPQLDFEVAELPQINPSKTRNVAYYPVEVVSKNTPYPDEAWDFIQFAAREENVREYLRYTNRPTALRSLINEQITDPEAKPFVSQVLTAESWYQGQDWSETQDAFAYMIEARPGEDLNYLQIVSNAVDMVDATLR